MLLDYMHLMLQLMNRRRHLQHLMLQLMNRRRHLQHLQQNQKLLKRLMLLDHHLLHLNKLQRHHLQHLMLQLHPMLQQKNPMLLDYMHLMLQLMLLELHLWRGERIGIFLTQQHRSSLRAQVLRRGFS